ncbi:MAG: hypothetical protein DMF62_12480 [Acidobacteria bacterium]|nr:MAG: hypothetical protein DMF62_12480 [Acidobacteriota bacterium]
MKGNRLIIIVLLLYFMTGVAAYLSTHEKNDYTVFAQELPQGCHTLATIRSLVVYVMASNQPQM